MRNLSMIVMVTLFSFAGFAIMGLAIYLVDRNAGRRDKRG